MYSMVWLFIIILNETPLYKVHHFDIINHLSYPEVVVIAEEQELFQLIRNCLSGK